MSPLPTTDSARAPDHRGGRDNGRNRHLPRRPTEGSSATADPFDPRDRFAAYIAHELRTPIALQLALAEAALADTHSDVLAFRAMAEAVVASCEQQQRLIEALLDLARSQQTLTRRMRVDIAAITSQALQAHELSELDSVVALEPAAVTGDPTLLERLAANLVSNAIRHNIPQGRIEVATRSDAGSALLSVANTGPCIPARELTRLFQPFQRLGAQPEACADGVGLGLAIVQSIADAHNATVTARTRATGGLDIEVRFPESATPQSYARGRRTTGTVIGQIRLLAVTFAVLGCAVAIAACGSGSPTRHACLRVRR